jgi:Plasmid replication region DNA-binding N-term
MDKKKNDGRDRVIAAADELFAANDRTTFPGTYEVRKLAGTSMGIANSAMQEWRSRKLLSIANPIEVEVPKAVQDASRVALGQLWSAATQISAQSLMSAQKGFDEQAAVAVAHSEDLSLAFDTQTAELETLRGEYENFRTQTAASNAVQESERQDAALERVMLLDRANTAAARAEEMDKRIDDLRMAIGKLERAESITITDCSTRLAQAETDLLAARTDTAAAREDSARLHGKCESLTLQLNEMLQAAKRRRKSRGPRKVTLK